MNNIRSLAGVRPNDGVYQDHLFMTTTGAAPVVEPMVGSNHAVPAPLLSNDLSQLPQLRNRVRRYVDSVVGCLPIHETQAYLEAMSRDPQLVLTETDPLQFVRYCEYDLFAGVKRLCLYWTKRKELFGPERAFLPLALTGTGALTPQDLLTLRAGFPALLPNTKSGQQCILIDRRKFLPNVSLEAHLRCTYYWCKVLAEDDVTQVDGALVIVIAVTPRCKGPLMAELIRERTSLFQTIFPVKFKFHLLSIPSQTSKTSFGSEVISDAVSLIRQNYSSASENIRVHVENEPNQILNELLELGLTKEGIPLLLGGQWRFEDFSDWCRDRMEWEQELYKDRLLDDSDSKKQGRPSNVMDWKKFTQDTVGLPALGGTADTTNHVNDGTTSTPPAVAAYAAAAAAPSSSFAAAGGPSTSDDHEAGGKEDQDKLAKRRMADMLRSRQKRERQRVKFQNLQEECSRLTGVKERLQSTNVILSRLLIEAEECVAELLEEGQ
ncbi:hypothetical protein ACA910_009826 [Epithemia clementina (nom. ined.)]